MRSILLAAGLIGSGLWFTPDQQGRRHFERGEFALAAEAFRDPMWQGAAWFRAGKFERAARAFARRDSPEALYDQGNARLMLGEYADAIGCYDSALAMRPDWKEALDNRALAAARAARLDFEGGDMTGGMLGADDVVFDEQADAAGESVETVGGEELSDQQIQALWLRRLKTRPADFLKAKFAYQQAVREREDR